MESNLQIQYDCCGRMKYHPLFHENQGKPWSEEDEEYLCKYSSVDDLETLAMALGRTKATVASKLTALKKARKYDLYKNLNKHW